jgi:hypothetical protein
MTGTLDGQQAGVPQQRVINIALQSFGPLIQGMSVCEAVYGQAA